MRRTILLVLLAFASTLPSGFFCDDALLRESIERGTGWGILRYSIDTQASGIYLWPLDEPMVVSYFRPLVLASFKVESTLAGHHALLAHAVNLALHALNVLLAGRIGIHLGLGPRIAAIAALVWGVSIHAAPAVGWISGRSELLSGLFVLLAVLVSLTGAGRSEKRWPLFCFASIVLGCAAKESAVVAPVLVLLACAAAGTHPRRILARRAWLFALVVPAVLYALLVATIGLPRIPRPYFDPIESIAGVARLGAKFVLYGSSALAGIPIIPVASMTWLESHWVAVAPMLAGLILAFVFWGRRAGPSARVLLAWSFVALAPYALVTAFSLYLYLPFLGLCWLFGLAIQNRRERWSRAWIAWLVVSGMAANVAAGLYLCKVDAASQQSIDRIAGLTSTGRVRDVLLLDAPYWAYSLPSAIRMREPTASFRTHFLNMNMEPGPRAASRLNWVGDRELILFSEPPLFRSPIERFFLFGADPLTSGQSTTRNLYLVSYRAESDDGNPLHELQIQFTDSFSFSSAAMLQFDGWSLREVDLPRR